MTWTKLSDDFTDDCWDLSSDAFRTHVEGLTWSNRKLLDLRIPKADFRRFAKHPEAVTELLATGWWTDTGDAYLIQHHGVYQRTRDAVIRQQAARQANGRKGGRPPKAPREQARNITPETKQVRYPVTEQVPSSVIYPVADLSASPLAPHPKSPGRTATETYPVRYQVSEQLTERDRTGLAWTKEVQTNGSKTMTAEPDPPAEAGLACDWCGSTGPTSVDGWGRRVCVDRCDQEML